MRLSATKWRNAATENRCAIYFKPYCTQPASLNSTSLRLQSNWWTNYETDNRGHSRNEINDEEEAKIMRITIKRQFFWSDNNETTWEFKSVGVVVVKKLIRPYSVSWTGLDISHSYFLVGLNMSRARYEPWIQIPNMN